MSIPLSRIIESILAIIYSITIWLSEIPSAEISSSISDNALLKACLSSSALRLKTASISILNLLSAKFCWTFSSSSASVLACFETSFGPVITSPVSGSTISTSTADPVSLSNSAPPPLWIDTNFES